MSKLIWNTLCNLDFSGPIFWVDKEGTFDSTLDHIKLPRRPERTSVEQAFQLRLEASGSSDPLAGRLLYARDVADLEPLAEIARCFGIIAMPRLDDIIESTGIVFSVEERKYVRDYPAAVIACWDTISPEALSEGALRAGIAAAIVGSAVVDPVEIAVSFLRKARSGRRAMRHATSLAGDSIERQEMRAVQNYLVHSFELRDGEIEGELIRVAILGNLVAGVETQPLVVHLLKAPVQLLSTRLADRILHDQQLSRDLHPDLSLMSLELELPLQMLKDDTLLRLALIPAARETLVNRVRARLSGVQPEDARGLLAAKRAILWEDPAFAMFREAGECFDAIDASDQDFGDTSRSYIWYVERYSREWYQVDANYRRAMIGVEGGTKAALQTAYRQWLNKSNTAFADALNREPNWLFPDAQRDLGKSFISMGRRTAVVIMDALRFELAQEILRRLGREYKYQLTFAIATLPSITEVGMSALAPSAGLMRLNVKDKKLRVFVGERETTQKSARDQIWTGAGYRVIDPQDAALLSPADEKVAVFHGAVDAIGEKLQTDFFAHVEELLMGLVQLFRDLLNKGFDVVGTSDHGFLTLPPFDQSGYLAVGTTNDEVKKRRYRISADEPLEPPIISRTAKQLGLDGDVTVGFPPAASILSAHGALTFLHGGISLQELVIPVMRIRSKSATQPMSWEVVFPDRLKARMVRVSVVPPAPGVGKNLRLSLWRGLTELVAIEKAVEIADQPLIMSTVIPEGVDGGELLLKVAIVSGLAVAEKRMLFEPERN